jgi:hypothetical protein
VGEVALDLALVSTANRFSMFLPLALSFVWARRTVPGRVACAGQLNSPKRRFRGPRAVLGNLTDPLGRTQPWASESLSARIHRQDVLKDLDGHSCE